MICPYNSEHEFDTEQGICVECGAPADKYDTTEEVQKDDFTGLDFRIISNVETAAEIMEGLYRSRPDLLAFDMETTGFDIINDLPHGFSLATSEMSWYFVNGAGIEAAKTLDRIGHNNHTIIIGHNLKFDLHFLKKWGASISEKQAADTLLMAYYVDENQELGLKNLAEGWLGIYDLPEYKDLLKEAKKHLDVSRLDEINVFDLPLGSLGCYAARDTRLTYDLYLLLKEALEKVKDSRLDPLEMLKNEEIPFLYLLKEMEEIGMYVDTDEWEKANQYFEAIYTKAIENWENITKDIVIKLSDCSFFPTPFVLTNKEGVREEVHNLTADEVLKRLGEEEAVNLPEHEKQLLINEYIKRRKKDVGIAFPVLKGEERAWKHMTAATYQTAPHNYNSTQQISNILFSKKELGGLGFRPTATTDTGKPKLDGINVVRLLRNYGHRPIGGDMLRLMREIADSSKMLSTYLSPLKESRDANGFVHASLNQTGTVTGRLSSSNPLNLQNQPSKGDRGRLIRSIFRAPYDHYCLVCDFSQLELRLLAHYSKSDTLINLFKENGDPHALTAELAGVERHVGKTINFAWAYGAWWLTIAETLEKLGYERPSKQEATKWLDDFDIAYPELVKWKEKVIKYAKNLKGVRTIAGRWRRLHNINSHNQKERNRAARQAVNSIIQGSAGDVMRRAMLDLRPHMRWYNAKLVMQVHDEVVIYVPNSVDREEISKVVQETMEGAGKFFNLRVPLVAEPNTGDSWYEAK